MTIYFCTLYFILTIFTEYLGESIQQYYHCLVSFQNRLVALVSAKIRELFAPRA
jgi:hypothetical protein